MAGGGIDSLLDISRRALFVQTQAIRVTGSNVANANTEGYSRRDVEFVSSSGGQGLYAATGTGVDLNRVIRVVDSYLNSEYTNRLSETSSWDVRNEMLSRAEAPFSLESTSGHIGYELSAFFSSLEDLASNPASIPLRSAVLEAGQNLTQSINIAYNETARLQREADNRIGTLVQDVNRLTSQIADINKQISGSEWGNQQALTLRDERDKLLTDLSKLISFDTVTTDDGAVLVSLRNGFSLVTGNDARSISFERNVSPSIGTFTTGLDGSSLGHIVYDFNPTGAASYVDLTNIVAGGGGEVAGLLNFRGLQSLADTSPFQAIGDCPDIASRIEAITRNLLTVFNQTYQGTADENAGTPVWDSNAGGLNGTRPTLDGLFGIEGSMAALDTTDAAGNPGADGRLQPADLNSATAPATYSGILTFKVTDPAALAAALDLDPAPGTTQFAAGDARNLQQLIDLRKLPQDWSLGRFSATNVTIEQVYHNTVAFVGGLASQAENQYTVSKARESQVAELKNSVSGVSLDEEFANLINYQRAFEASARMIKVGDELLAQILGLLG